MYIGESEVSSRMPEGEPLVIEAEEMQNRRMQIMNMHFVMSCLESKLIRFAVRHAPFDTAPCHPHREAMVIVISTITVF